MLKENKQTFLIPIRFFVLPILTTVIYVILFGQVGKVFINIVASFEVSAIQKDTIYKIPEGPFQGFEGIVKNINATIIQLLLVDLGFLITLTR